MATFNGTISNDTIVGGWGDDLINGNDGNDLLDGFYGFDTINGGKGDDTATYALYLDENGAGILADLKSGIVSFPGNSTQSETLIDIENLIGSWGNDGLYGTDLNNSLIGGYGNDWLDGRDGNDNLQGGGGNDRLLGGTGNDTMMGEAGDDSYFVESVRDVVIEAVDGGNDTVFTSLESYTIGENVENLNLGYMGIAGTGNRLNNQIIGNALDNALYGQEGDDILYGNAGDDGLIGNSGNDTMQGGIGNDSYWVEQSGDVVVEAATSGTDTVFATVNYTLGDNVENLYLMPHSNASEGIGNDLNNAIGLANTSSADRLGGSGDQNLILSGMGGDDTLSGGSGKDLLTGGVGRDLLTGGGGNDRYVYSQLKDAGDTITDFANGDDVLDLRDLFASFDAIVADPVATGYLRLTSVGGNTQVEIDPDGKKGKAGFTTLVTVNGIAPDQLGIGKNLLVPMPLAIAPVAPPLSSINFPSLSL
ncbi:MULTISPECIES: type I secretion C-terminal target domain-containing protein [unclassified Microcoleus]|uniref:type I secretion C-terminal target domain-containing protein n=1 Tax=unclassified Microcoleus TaxID=2642155 RepID=UPI002FCF5810